MPLLFFVKRMNTTEKEAVAQTLREQPAWIKVGRMRFRVKPLTLCQIYELGVFANDMTAGTWGEDDKINIIQELIAHHKDARLMCEIFLVCAFRKRLPRWFFGRYIRKNLTIVDFNNLIQFIAKSFNANFFLTSITFLTRTKIMTEPKTTPRGRQ